MKTPPEILEKLEQAAAEIRYCAVSLTVEIKHGKLRYIVRREESFVSNMDDAEKVTNTD